MFLPVKKSNTDTTQNKKEKNKAIAITDVNNHTNNFIILSFIIFVLK